MSLLVGDANDAYAEAASLAAGHQQGWQFEAAHSGDATELYFLTAGGIANTGISSVKVAVYSDDGNAPDALLGSATVSASTPPQNTFLEATSGFTIPIVRGTTYWLAVLANGSSGSLHFNTAFPSGHGASVKTPNATGSPLATWPTFDAGTDVAYTNGPTAISAGGEIDDPPLPERASDLVWHVTGLWYPGETSVIYYGQIVDPTADSYIDTINDQSTGEVTFNIGAQDPDLLANLIGKAYARFLKIYDCGRLAFWGPYKLSTVDVAAGTCTLNCVDPSLRLSRHVLRRGDLLGTLNEANDDKGSVSVDHIGLRQLRDAGKNSTEQTAEGYPDLGIGDGDNDYDEFPFNRMGVQRLDQVFNQMQQLSQSLGPDFSFRAVEDIVGSYALLDTFVHQGEDISSTVAFHIGTGLQNLENLVVTEGSKYTTHIHVLPRDIRQYRFTQANPDAARITGPYVDADATDYDSKGIDPEKVEEVLRAYGDDYLKAYGRPLVEVVLTLPVDGQGVPRYGVDFKKGDTVGVAGRIKAADGQTLWNLAPAPFRIMSVRRRRDGEGIRSEITVVGDMVAAAGDALSGAGSGDEH